MKPVILFFMAMLILLIAPACSPVQGAVASSMKQDIGGQAALDNPVEEQPLPPAEDIPAPPRSDTPEGMVAFEGDLLVTSSPPLAELWQRAGWRIADQPIDTASQTAPSDCTLYPNAGIPGQWVGACRGYILIPEEGAKHIAVMITNPDGSTTLVQVAPVSTDDQP